MSSDIGKVMDFFRDYVKTRSANILHSIVATSAEHLERDVEQLPNQVANDKLINSKILSKYVSYEIEEERGIIKYDGGDEETRDMRIHEFIGSSPFYMQFVASRDPKYIKRIVKKLHKDIKVKRRL